MDELLSSTPAAKAFDYDQVVVRKKITERVHGKNYVSETEKGHIFAQFWLLGRSEVDLGWKIHVSLIETSENLRKAWNLIVDALASYGIETSKVLKKEFVLPEFQLGKEITIYCQEAAVDWNKMLQEISILFIKNGVLPNYKALNDKAIPGSIYFSCRTDKDRRGDNVLGLDVDTHNPSGKPHFFEDLKINQNELSPTPLVKPERKNEQNIKIFYRMLNRNLGSTVDNLYKTFDRTIPKFHKYNNDTFLEAVKRLYVIPEVDAANLNDCLNRLNTLERQFEQGMVQIESLSDSQFREFYERCEKDFGYINNLIKETIEHILKTEAEQVLSGSDEGSVKYHSSGSDDDSPRGDPSAKEKLNPPAAAASSVTSTQEKPQESKPSASTTGTKVSQSSLSVQATISASQHALHNPPISGMERMITSIADTTGVAIEEIERLESQQIYNVFKIIHSQNHNTDLVCEVIISAIESKKITLDQIKDISDEMKSKIDTALGYKRTSSTLKIGDILSAIENIKKLAADRDSAHTSILPPDSPKSQTTPHKQH